jgi:nicotinamide mononucleotide transporter
MNIDGLFHLLWQQLTHTDWLQWAAVLFGIAEVLLARSNKIWLYPMGITSVIISIYVLFDSGLYAECLLNIYYLVMSIYGWWYWIKKRNLPPVLISHCNRKDWTVVLLFVSVGFLLLVVLLKYYTPSTVPLWDAWVSCTAWAGMWLLAKRKVENWLLLNISNAFAIPLLLYKQLPLYAALTIFLFIVAVQGYYKWKKIAQQYSDGTAPVFIH